MEQTMFRSGTVSSNSTFKYSD